MATTLVREDEKFTLIIYKKPQKQGSKWAALSVQALGTLLIF